MSIAVTDEHQEIARVARSFLASHDARAGSRALLEEPADRLPSFWTEMAELGWTGLLVDEELGGQGFGLSELAIVVEELGYAVAPGPFLPTAIAAALLVERGSDAARSAFLPGLADGSLVAAVGLGGDLALDDAGKLGGSAGLVLGGELAGLLVLCVGDDVALLRPEDAGLTVSSRKNLDPGRRFAAVDCEGVAVPEGSLLEGARGALVRLARTLGAAEAAGAARACTEMATGYAKVREQFGRTIGTFGPVKHHCANMLMATEQATAGAWGASRADLDESQAELAAATACSLAVPALLFCAEHNIQVLGGIGFTWEHDAHLYQRRAIALAALLDPDAAREDVTRLRGEGIRIPISIELPAEAETFRAEVREFAERYRAVPKEDKRKALFESGYLVPHWPEPWGRDAGAVEQLVIDEELAGEFRPDLGISGWNVLTIAQHGNDDQRERFVRPALEGELEFCQLFSEPGAGSDAAAVKTRAVKVDGGWRVTGQKVWTSLAHLCNRGFATVRTNPDAAKHDGISMMVIDMKAEGVEIRPLRQITGHSHFNEVFLENVFVPDEDVVGPVDGGWAVARSTLGNERVSIGGGDLLMAGQPDILALLGKHAPGDTGLAREVGAALAETDAIALINLRGVVSAVQGTTAGKGSNLTKLLGAELNQRKAALAARLAGPAAAVRDGDEKRVGTWLMAMRSMTIAGGTSEIIRNQIAERQLGLPRDPLIQ